MSSQRKKDYDKRVARVAEAVKRSANSITSATSLAAAVDAVDKWDREQALARAAGRKTPLQRMRLITQKDNPDDESDHSDADELLCSLVAEYVPNGRAVVNEYKGLTKYYG